MAATAFLAACGSDGQPSSATSSTASTTSSTSAVVASSSSSTTTGHDVEGDDHENGEHEHVDTNGLDVDRSNPIPGIVLEVFAEDEQSGEYLLLLELTDFTITPENVDQEPVANEGHVHLLVDGAEVERFFDVEHRFTLEPGEHVVEVELNANDHRPWTVDGARINATALVEVPGAADGNPDGDVEIAITISASTVEVAGGDRVEVPVGSSVAMVVTTDTVEELHVHGYDERLDLEAGENLLEFIADVTGRFEVELEGSGTFVLELVVS